MGQAQDEHGEQVAQGCGVDLQGEVPERVELGGEVVGGQPQGSGVIGQGAAQDRCVRVFYAGAGGGHGVEEVLAEQDQGPLGVGEVAPLLDLAGADPEP
ncbi:hypothetical protein SCANM63S_02346 [Streptomyces canarius]